MESTDKQLFIERVIQGCILCSILGIAIWYAPTWMLSLTKTKLSSTEQSHHNPSHHIDEIVAEIAIAPHNEDIYNGIHFSTFLIENPKEIADQLYVTLQEKNIESYLLRVDDWDMDLYIYHEGILIYRLLFLQKISTPPIPGETKPKIAVVIGGLGQTLQSEIIDHPTPLTLAFSPSKPFSTFMAIEAAKNWHEVLIDIRDQPSVPNPIELLPFASGFLHQNTELFRTAQEATYVYPSKGTVSSSFHPLSLLSRKYIDVPNIITRAKYKAITQGFAGILINSQDPQRNALLEWTKKAEQEGFHLVMASELRYRLSEATTIPKEPVE